MSKKESKKMLPGNLDIRERRQRKSVRGSGFTYDEDLEQTDHSIPVTDEESPDIVKLPDLGRPNRP